MKDGRPDPSVDLSPTGHLEPFPQFVLRPDASTELAESAEIDIEVSKAHQDGEGFLDGAEAVEWPFAVDCTKRPVSSRHIDSGLIGLDHHAHWSHREPGRILSVNECAHWYLQSSSHDHPNARRYAAMGGWEGSQ